MDTFDLRTRERNQFVEITERVRVALRQSGVQQGACVVYCPHTTAAVTINENDDPNVCEEVLGALSRSIERTKPRARAPSGKVPAFGKSMAVMDEDGWRVLSPPQAHGSKARSAGTGRGETHTLPTHWTFEYQP